MLYEMNVLSEVYINVSQVLLGCLNRGRCDGSYMEFICGETGTT